MKKIEKSSRQNAQVAESVSASASTSTLATTNPVKEKTAVEVLTDEMMTLIGRARRGDEQVAQIVMRQLNEHPSIQKNLCKALGDMGRIAWQQWAAAIGKEDHLQRACILEHASHLRSQIAGLNPSPMEQLLADRIALASVQLSYYESLHARNVGNHEMSTHIEERISHANRQLIASIKTLVTVRRLLVPAIQVNIAEQQRNSINLGS